MRLIRNTTPDGTCKYALIRLDKIRQLPPEEKAKYQAILDQLPANILEYGQKGTEEECFVIKLKDVNAPAALRAYATAALRAYATRAVDSDIELAKEVLELANRAKHHPKRHHPD